MSPQDHETLHRLAMSPAFFNPFFPLRFHRPWRRMRRPQLEALRRVYQRDPQPYCSFLRLRRDCMRSTVLGTAVVRFNGVWITLENDGTIT